MDRNKFIIIIVGFLDVLSIWMIIPTLPDLATLYWVSAHLISYGVTSYAFCAFLATPLLWQLSDIFGRKKILTLCVLGSFLSSLVIGIIQTYPVFIIWRIINWITWWNISILQAIITDVSKSKQERMENMWILWTLFGLGFIVWPLVGAVLLHFWPIVPYRFMAIVSLIETFILLIHFKETNKHMEVKKIEYNPFKKIIFYLKKKTVNLYFISFFILILAIFIYQPVLTLYLNQDYGLSGSQAWYIFAAFGLLLALNQMFFLRKFWLKKFTINQLFYIINFGAFIIFLALFVVSVLFKNLRLFLCLFLMIVPIQTLIMPIYQSEIVEHGTRNTQWEIAWVISSLQSVSMFVWPLIWGILLDRDMSIFSVSFIVALFSIFIVFKINSKPKAVVE